MAWSFTATITGSTDTYSKTTNFYSNSYIKITSRSNCEVYPLFDEANNNAYNTSTSYLVIPNTVRLQPMTNNSNFIMQSDNIYWSFPLTSNRSQHYPGGTSSGYLDIVFCLVHETSTNKLYLIYVPWYASGSYSSWTASSQYVESNAIIDTPTKKTNLYNVFNRIDTRHFSGRANKSTILNLISNCSVGNQELLARFDNYLPTVSNTSTLSTLKTYLDAIGAAAGVSSTEYTTRNTLYNNLKSLLENKASITTLKDSLKVAISNFISNTTMLHNRGSSAYNQGLDSYRDTKEIISSIPVNV